MVNDIVKCHHTTDKESQHDKTNNVTCAPSEDSDSAWASTQFDQRLRCPLEEALVLAILRAHNEYFDQTGRMPTDFKASLGAHVTYLVWSCCGSNGKICYLSEGIRQINIVINRQNFDMGWNIWLQILVNLSSLLVTAVAGQKLLKLPSYEHSIIRSAWTSNHRDS